MKLVGQELRRDSLDPQSPVVSCGSTGRLYAETLSADSCATFGMVDGEGTLAPQSPVESCRTVGSPGSCRTRIYEPEDFMEGELIDHENLTQPMESEPNTSRANPQREDHENLTQPMESEPNTSRANPQREELPVQEAGDLDYNLDDKGLVSQEYLLQKAKQVRLPPIDPYTAVRADFSLDLFASKPRSRLYGSDAAVVLVTPSILLLL